MSEEGIKVIQLPQFEEGRGSRLSNVTNFLYYTGRFIMFSVITNIYKKKKKEPTLMELFTASGKLKNVFSTTRDVRSVHQG
jgi:hypothetical protein